MIKMLPDEMGVSVIEFNENEIVRHRLTKFFVKLFEHPEYKKQNKPNNLNIRVVTKKKTLLEKLLDLFR
jgi:hypothetical protein